MEAGLAVSQEEEALPCDPQRRETRRDPSGLEDEPSGRDSSK